MHDVTDRAAATEQLGGQLGDVPATSRVRGNTIVRVPDAKIALSTSAVYPESTATAFELAARLGYDGLELMVGADELSQDIDAIEHLSEYHGLPVVSIHAPCLLITQRVWGTDPWGKVEKSLEAAHRLGASTVVLHPPFRWQRDYAREFVRRVNTMERESGVAIAVENMYPWRAGNRGVQAYLPGWDPREFDYEHVTLDLSHTATAAVDALEMAQDLGSRLSHLHLTDGSGSIKDEHLVPGRGNQPCAEVLEHLARRNFTGALVVEVMTRRTASRSEREADLAESLAFARLHFAAPVRSSYAVDGAGTVHPL